MALDHSDKLLLSLEMGEAIENGATTCEEAEIWYFNKHPELSDEMRASIREVFPDLFETAWGIENHPLVWMNKARESLMMQHYEERKREKAVQPDQEIDRPEGKREGRSNKEEFDQLMGECMLKINELKKNNEEQKKKCNEIKKGIEILEETIKNFKRVDQIGSIQLVE